MADNLKAEKIAAAKKKLKQFKSKTKADGSLTLSGNDTNININENIENVSKPINIAEMQQQHQITMHFNAIDPLQFDSTQQFYNIASPEQINIQSNLDITTNKLPIENMPPQDTIHQHIQPPIFHSFSNFNQTEAKLDHQSFQTSLEQPNQNIYEIAADVNVLNSIANANISQLESQNQELTNLLQVEKIRNHELSLKVTQQHTTIDELNRQLEHFKNNNNNTIQDIQRELNAHVQTVNILVGEKADLIAKLQQKDQRINDFESQTIELQGRLNASRHRVAELEKDLNTLSQSNRNIDGSTEQALASQFEQLQDENKRLQRLHQDVSVENTEINYQLTLKIKEINELKNALSLKSNELEIVRVRLEQLNDGETIQSEVNAIDQQHQQDQRGLDTERQIIELQNMISELTNDRDRIEQQYKTYVQHLTDETNTMNQRIQDLNKTNEKLTKREVSLVDHVRELEKQIQKQISTQHRLAALREENKLNTSHSNEFGENTNVLINDEVKALQNKLDAYEKEKSELIEHSNQKVSLLEQQFFEKDAELLKLESEIERLRTEKPDTSNILATIESDKVAASRAMAQNQELKRQLEEIEKVYILVSNDKLELTNQLQSEQYLSRDIRSRFGDIEDELKTVKQKLHFKDEEMIRLTHENAQFEANIAELTKKLDITNESAVKHATELQRKLHIANKEIKQLKCKLDVMSNVNGAEEHLENIENGQINKSSDELNENDIVVNAETIDDGASATTDPIDNSDIVSVTSTINIATNEAMDKLQDRFKRTMTEIADLTEEKHRLEHLVTQLQSETETIGEYIALYQTQRRLLKQREIEKDIQLHRIAADREDMIEKLRQLNELVELLLLQKGFANAKEIMSQLNASNNNCEKSPTNQIDSCENGETPANISIADASTSNNTNKDEIIISQCDDNQHPRQQQQNTDSLQSHINQNHDDEKTRETATKIINLLTEIKDRNLNQEHSLTLSAAHHCPCCSGKLEVV